jgi:hypothetical protein
MEGADAVVQEYEAKDDESLWWYPLWEKSGQIPVIQINKPVGWAPVMAVVCMDQVEVMGSLREKSQKLTEDTVLRLQAKNIM